MHACVCVCGHAPGPGVIVLAWGLKKKQRGESTHLANVVKHIKNYKKDLPSHL